MTFSLGADISGGAQIAEIALYLYCIHEHMRKCIYVCSSKYLFNSILYSCVFILYMCMNVCVLLYSLQTHARAG